MAKRKPYFKKHKVFTYEEVLQQCQEYRDWCKSDGREWWFNHQGEFFGYQYHYQYVKLGHGWVEAPEMVCEYCIHSVINNYGSEAERKAFNALCPLGEENVCWITNKDYAEMRSRKVRRKREYKRYSKMNRRDIRRGTELVFVEA